MGHTFIIFVRGNGPFCARVGYNMGITAVSQRTVTSKLSVLIQTNYYRSLGLGVTDVSTGIRTVVTVVTFSEYALTMP